MIECIKAGQRLVRDLGNGTYINALIQEVTDERVVLSPYQIKPIPTPGTNQTKRCECQDPVKVVLWAGMRWWGTPWPMRLCEWIRTGAWPDKPGCGCLVKLKALRRAMQMVRRA